jgi:hypothetical protein
VLPTPEHKRIKIALQAFYKLPCYKRSRNSATDIPASLTTPSIVRAFTGLWRGNGDEMRTVAHDDVFALADNLKSRLFERLHGPKMIDAGNFRHLLNRHFHFAHVGTTNTFVYGGKIILNGIANVLHRLLLGFSLGPATGKRWAIHRVTLV